MLGVWVLMLLSYFLLATLLLGLSAEIRILFVFPFIYLGASRLSWCSWSPRSQGTQGKRQGFPSPYKWCFGIKILDLPVVAEFLAVKRGPCRKAMLFPFKLTSVLYPPSLSSLYIQMFWESGRSLLETCQASEGTNLTVLSLCQQVLH